MFGEDAGMCFVRSFFLSRVSREQELVHSLHAPVVESVVEQVKKSYTDELPGLPYPELPVVTVTCASACSRSNTAFQFLF